MYRLVEKELCQWQKKPHPHPLLLRGARQVGKSYIVEKFAKEKFKNFVMINFEFQPHLKKIFDTLDPQKIIEKINSEYTTNINPGETLLFLDEIQECPQAILALRYFYEKIPGLHVIGAGSLLDFTLRSGDFSVPVGRVHYLFLGPLSFKEYLMARDKQALLEYLGSLDLDLEPDDFYHQSLIEELRNYSLLGGMPEVVNTFIQGEDLSQIVKTLSAIVVNYRDDFGKYASRAKHKHLERLLYEVPKSISHKFKYVNIDPEAQSRDLKEAFDLLINAGVMYKVKRTNGQGLPFEAGASEKHFKALFLDIGLMQNILGIKKEIMGAENFISVASGALAEQFVGQELLAYQEFYLPKSIYYWAREQSGSAEVDYMLSHGSEQIPVEVKAGLTGRLRSLRYFIEHYQCPFGLRFSQKKEVYFEDKVLSLPLYAVCELERIISATISKYG